MVITYSDLLTIASKDTVSHKAIFCEHFLNKTITKVPKYDQIVSINQECAIYSLVLCDIYVLGLHYLQVFVGVGCPMSIFFPK